jgi:hypothetical protein
MENRPKVTPNKEATSPTVLRHWYVRVGEPVSLHSAETGRFKQFIVECSDPATIEDAIKNAIREAAGFLPAGLTMRWHELKEIQIEKTPAGPPTFTRENGHIKIWLVTNDPGNVL